MPTIINRAFVKSVRRTGGGIPKVRSKESPRTQVGVDALTQAVESLTGLRRNDLDQAITYRILQANGFAINLRGRSQTIGIPAPVGGRTSAPTNLVAAADVTTHIVRLTWNQPASNTKFVEVWRSSTDDITTAQLFAVSLIGLWEFCQSATDTTYYYWIRSLGTDGIYSGFEPNTTTGVGATV